MFWLLFSICIWVCFLLAVQLIRFHCLVTALSVYYGVSCYDNFQKHVCKQLIVNMLFLVFSSLTTLVCLSTCMCVVPWQWVKMIPAQICCIVNAFIMTLRINVHLQLLLSVLFSSCLLEMLVLFIHQMFNKSLFELAQWIRENPSNGIPTGCSGCLRLLLHCASFSP